MTIAYLGIGSNLGDRKKFIDSAITRLSETPKLTVLRVSSIYETEPVGGPKGQEKFLNGVIEIDTSLKPKELFDICKVIEKDLGRVKTEIDGPRTVDLDILIFNKLILNDPDLVIPHPRMHHREFVLKGFAELNEQLVHPVLNRKIVDLYTDLVKF